MGDSCNEGVRNMEEIWKDVKGFEGLYQVSSLGKIKSFVKDKRRRNYEPEFKPQWLPASFALQE